ncbi:MAG: hypothetical protein M3Y27_13155 [Acidobacteriota bacterium]|nr:hypothetical protein [Acidobacteriota bacterium]
MTLFGNSGRTSFSPLHGGQVFTTVFAAHLYGIAVLGRSEWINVVDSKGAAKKIENECKKRPDAPLAFSSPEQRDEMRAIQLQELRNRIDMGLAEAGRGER